jgi:uncharacterized protein YecE (DUF72 family)
MVKTSRAVFRIGTSNIVVPGSKLTFPVEYQSKTRLHYYSTIFNSLEINSSFYKIPMARTFARWSTEVPPDFQFTVKLWKGITHEKELAFTPADIDRFMKAADCIGKNKGCLLIQFPGKITNQYAPRLEAILQQLKRIAPTWRKAIEFRHNSWYNKDTYALLDRYRASLVLHDMPKSMPTVLNKKARFVFLRFHGKAGDYRGTYSRSFLKQKSKQINEWLKEGRDVYAYFNNSLGEAYNNARLLRDLVKKP